MYKRVHVIINPAAGQDKPILGILNKAFGTAGVDWEVFVTKEAGDATRLARKAVEEGVDAVAVHGGDGTVSEVAAGLVGSAVPMAIVPGGTANVMSLELGIPSDPTEACTLVAGDESQIRQVDIGQMGDHYFILRLGMGLEAEMVKNATREVKAQMGNLAYVFSALQALRDPQLTRYLLTLDGHEVEVDGITCMIANSGSLGAPGLRLAPNVDISDGLLDVLVIRKGDLGSILAVAASVVAGADMPEPYQRWQARDVQVIAGPPQSIQADGEIIGTTPANVTVRHNALRVIVPAPKEAVQPAVAVEPDAADLGALGGVPALA